jgi:hypothetical protein
MKGFKDHLCHALGHVIKDKDLREIMDSRGDADGGEVKNYQFKCKRCKQLVYIQD